VGGERSGSFWQDQSASEHIASEDGNGHVLLNKEDSGHVNFGPRFCDVWFFSGFVCTAKQNSRGYGTRPSPMARPPHSLHRMTTPPTRLDHR
jgi:hypothetical protein